MFTLGLDYGTNSVRALIVRCSDGAEYGSRVVNYPSGAQGVLLDPNDGLLARQYPGDYLVGLETSVKGALAEAAAKSDFSASKIVGVGVDTTGSSPLPVDASNRPLALDPKWKGELSAQCWLWKDHTSWREAAKITETSAKLRPQYIAKCGGTYSSEWFWSKVWHCLNVAPATFEAAFSWVEIADWIPSILAGVTDPRKVKRGVCAAGHKALYSDEWGGLPDKEFLAALDPRLADLRDRLYEKAYDALEPAGSLSAEWAEKLGLPAGIPIAIGEFDVHYGAIGSGVNEGTLVKVIGTSTCDCAVISRGEGRRRHSRHLRHRQRRDPSRLFRHRGRPVGGRRHLQMVGRRHLRRRRGASCATDRRGGQAEAGAGGPARARLEQRQPHHPGRSAPDGPASSARISTRPAPTSTGR